MHFKGDRARHDICKTPYREFTDLISYSLCEIFNLSITPSSFLNHRLRTSVAVQLNIFRCCSSVNNILIEDVNSNDGAAEMVQW